MKIYIFSSGSKGNTTLIHINNSYILIDLGVSKKYLEEHMSQFSLSIKDINYVLLTHDHSDHTYGLGKLHNIPVYGGEHSFKCKEYHSVIPYISFTLNDIAITPIELSHDAKNPLGFIIKTKNESLVYITDTGYISDKNLNLCKNATYYIIESNHDINMLINSNRPLLLKERIMSEFGHLSNDDCALYLSTLIGNNTKEIFLAHVSLDCNKYDLAKETCRDFLSKKGIDLNKIKIQVALQKDMIVGGYED